MAHGVWYCRILRRLDLLLVAVLLAAGCTDVDGKVSPAKTVPPTRRILRRWSEESVLDRLPPDLAYLAEPARKYGVHQFDSEIDAFLEKADEPTRNELAKIAERIRTSKHAELIAEFLDQYPLDEYSEAAKLYFFEGILTTAGFKIVDKEPDTVESRIKELGRHGSYRLASNRMWAARILADFGAEARPAIEPLRTALSDEDLRVQIWAHYALALIEGDRPKHIQAIKTILARPDSQPNGDPDNHVAMEGEAALEKLRGEMPD